VNLPSVQNVILKSGDGMGDFLRECGMAIQKEFAIKILGNLGIANGDL